MISIGTDLVKCERLKNIKLIDKIFTPKEIEYFKTHRSHETIAGMYAAKEALLKSLKCGLDSYSFLDIEVLHNQKTPYPYFNFYGPLKKEIDKNEFQFDLSISHDGEYATAVVICYQDSSNNR